MKNSFRRLAALALFLAASVSAHADDFTVSGSIGHHNDVVQLDFSLLTNGSDVRVWTDSWQSGLNFDPLIAVWRRSGSDFALVAQVDDDDTVGPGQGFYDAGIAFATLAAGDYRLTLVTAINEANGTLLSQGFTYDNEAPIPIGLWNQPSYDPNANDQKGPGYQVHFAGVNSVTPVPEPETWLLMGFGLVAMVSRRLRPVFALGRQGRVG